MGRYYILRGQEVVEEPNYAKWAEWHESAYDRVRRVAFTESKYGSVATDFLAVDLSLSKCDPPPLFETKVKGGWLDGQSARYVTLAEAEAGHAAWVARVRAAEEEHGFPPPGCPVW